MKLGPQEAYSYAAQWGSYMTSGDPGACMYGFDERFHVQTEQHRTDCLEWVAKSRKSVEAKPANYETDELDKLDALADALRLAPCDADESGPDEFTAAYIKALFWSDNAPGVTTDEWQATDEHDEGSIPGDVDARDLAPETLELIIADCAAFQRDNAPLLAQALERGYGAERAGHDFWFTRNGHGVGFWCREELEPDDAEYDRLTTIMVEARDDRDAWGKACAARDVLKEASLGQRLSRAAKAFGEASVYLGDDGKVYL